jgi:transposase InsO family protein
MASGEGLVPRVAEDVMPGQIKLDSVFLLYTRWRELGLPGSFKLTYVSNAELARPPAGAGLSGPCQAAPGTTSEHFNPPFEACLFAIGRYKGAAGSWDFSDAHGANVAGARLYPRTIRVDNGPEFVSRDLDLWAYQRGVTLDFSRPGKPTDNAFAESFNGKVRAECLNTAWFLSLDDARSKCEAWRRDYNEERPHSAIGDKCPIELQIGAGPYGPPGA